mgnify:CR=1 FL=1
MQIIQDPLLNILSATWDVILDAAPWMLLGFAMAGLLKAFLPDDLVARHLGAGSRFSVLKAALIGAPIPLCSCGVIPAAAGLRRQGAGRGATAAFLVATPETGVDSIAVTYALLDPVMTVLRPLSALLTAVVAGLGVSWLDRREAVPPPPPVLAPLAGLKGADAPASCSGGSCGCGARPASRPAGLGARLAHGMGYAFGELLGDVGLWFVGGAVLAGAFTALVPPQALSESLGTGLWSMVAALAASLPLYVCATATTPLVAALALKGLSPGAALVFLLAGPATNAATVAVVAGMLGRRAAALYVASIALCALGLGLFVNALYGWLGMDVTNWIATGAGETHGPLTTVMAVALLGLMALARLRSGHAA